MNRLKISEGGQPIYLDDLQLLQDNDIFSIKSLLQALGNGQRAFLLQPLQADFLNYDESQEKTTFLVKSGTLVVDGCFLTWSDTELQVSDWDMPMYLCVKTFDTDKRLFEDGQNRNCRTGKEVYLSLDPSGVSEYYSAFELPLFSNLIKESIGYKEAVWQQIKVTFSNGYTGTVKFKEQSDCYRVYVDIKSNNHKALSGSLLLFYTDKTFLQYFRSPCEAFVRTENGVAGGQLYGFEGNIYLDLQLPFDDASCAADVPVKVIFELPK